MEAAPGQEVRVSTMEADDSVMERVRGALSTLTEDERDIVLLHYNGLSVRAIADAMGMSKTTVHNRLPALLDRATELVKADEELGEMYGEGEPEGDTQE
jgi:RNA polymerase sigma factor (sigma-70 family)